MNGTFNVLAQERTCTKKKYAVIKFWKLREKLSLVLETQSVLYIYFLFLFFICYLFIYLFFVMVKELLRKVKKKVTAAFHKNKSGEYKKVRTRAADSYTGVS